MNTTSASFFRFYCTPWTASTEQIDHYSLNDNRNFNSKKAKKTPLGGRQNDRRTVEDDVSTNIFVLDYLTFKFEEQVASTLTLFSSKDMVTDF